jgi:hypothetical protein
MHRGLRPIAYVAVASCLGIFVYGLAVYPDAPYKACSSSLGYCGKSGRPHTEAEYRSQQVWERTLLVSAPFGILAAIYLARTTKASGSK